MFELKIVTPLGVFLTTHVQILNCPTTEGIVGLLKNHMPYVANLKEGELSFVNEKGRKTYLVKNGSILFKENVASVLVDEIIEKQSYES